MRYLLLLSSLFMLAACSKPELPEAVFTPTASVTATAAIIDAQPPVAVVSPKAMPSVDFQGIKMEYSEHLWGDLQESAHHPDTIDHTGTAYLEHIRLSFAGSDFIESPVILVFPISHYLSFSDNAASHIQLLRDILQNRPVQPRDPLPLFPLLDEAEIFYDLPDYTNFENGSGVSFVAQTNYENEEKLVYVFQGITDDDNFYIIALLPVKKSSEILTAAGGLDETLTQVTSQQDYLDLELEDTKNILVESMHSLKIQPRAEFPSPSPIAYFSFPGLLLAYDPEISGKATAELVPPTYVLTNGPAIFLAGVPDAVQIIFNGQERERRPTLLVQPLRGATKQFFGSIPTEQQREVQDLETIVAESSGQGEAQHGKGFERLLAFQNGDGLRHIISAVGIDGSGQMELHSYQFRGVTDDGRYFVTLEHPLDLDGSPEEVMLDADSDHSAEFLLLLSKLDQMIESLVIGPDLSTESSIPINAPDCTLDAQFVEDVTVPDHTVVERGSPFTKTWKVRNTGTCTWTPAYQIRFAGGNPLHWSQSNLLVVVPQGKTAEISVDIVSPEIPGNYQAWWQLVDDQEQPFGSFHYVLFEAPPPATDIPEHGVIEGEISYPSGGVPAMTIYFLRTDGSQRYALETEPGWVHYANELPVGDYYVFARVSGDEGDSGGGYTSAVLCGLTCDDHELVPVSIEEGKVTNAVNVFDWFAPAGTFPLP